MKLKKKNPRIKIVPRLVILLQEMSPNQFVDLLTNPDLIFDQLAAHLQKYDGVVLDLGSFFIQNIFDALFNFMHTIGLRLREQENRETLVTFFNPKMKTAQLQFANLRNFIEKSKDIFTHFILMSYDYNQNNELAPLWWSEKALDELLTKKSFRYDPPSSQQILLGVPFYGMDYGLKQIEAYLVPDRLEKMKKQDKKVEWNEKSEEHYVEEGSNISMVPSAQFFTRRRELAEKYEVGISIWQLGQGFEEWVDLV